MASASADVVTGLIVLLNGLMKPSTMSSGPLVENHTAQHWSAVLA